MYRQYCLLPAPKHILKIVTIVNLSHENMATDYAFMQPKFRKLYEKKCRGCIHSTHNTEHVSAHPRFSVKVFLSLFQRLVDKTKVMCLKWIPGSENLFLVAHESGNMFVYNKEHPPGLGPPQYALMKQGPGYSIHSGKSKTTRNPVCKWTIGEGSINEFAFSPDCKHIATANQDGFLRVFDFDLQTLCGVMKSYFGGLTCVCWSPDGKYIVTGGEDDLVTVWSFQERRVIARGVGHQSWVQVVAFDPYTTSVSAGGRVDDSDEDEIEQNGVAPSHVTSDDKNMTCYRFGSVGQDTNLMLWDLGDDVLKPQRPRGRSMRAATLSNSHVPTTNFLSNGPVSHEVNHSGSGNAVAPMSFDTPKSLTQVHSLSKSVEHLVNIGNVTPGTVLCPRMEEVSILEPLVAKKVANERLTALSFREDCIVMACHEGFIRTWARPGKVVSVKCVAIVSFTVPVFYQLNAANTQSHMSK